MLLLLALRPEEAINLRRKNIVLAPLNWNAEIEKWETPDDDWGEFHLERAAPHAGKEWTDSGRHRDERGLKHRADDEVRVVPIPPSCPRSFALTSTSSAPLRTVGSSKVSAARRFPLSRISVSGTRQGQPCSRLRS